MKYVYTTSFCSQASWKCKLRIRFKFLRRPAKSDSNEPHAKRHRVDEESFDSNVAELQEEMLKRKRERNVAIIQSLTSETFQGRRDWIRKQQPLVSDILTKFLSLKMRKVVGDHHTKICVFL